jgi:DNA repair protein RecN (Recombination protein N)
MASTNPGEPAKPLAKIASTGEMSRFMLALKSAFSEADNIPVLIFDEIDIGVGGRSGELIGKKLWTLARHRQVICITHLAQIAAYADAHFTISKVLSGERALSKLEKLEGDSTLKELAMMLSGPQPTDKAFGNAQELVQKAKEWKQSSARFVPKAEK